MTAMQTRIWNKEGRGRGSVSEAGRCEDERGGIFGGTGWGEVGGVDSSHQQPCNCAIDASPPIRRQPHRHRAGKETSPMPPTRLLFSPPIAPRTSTPPPPPPTNRPASKNTISPIVDSNFSLSCCRPMSHLDERPTGLGLHLGPHLGCRGLRHAHHLCNNSRLCRSLPLPVWTESGLAGLNSFIFSKRYDFRGLSG